MVRMSVPDSNRCVGGSEEIAGFVAIEIEL